MTLRVAAATLILGAACGTAPAQPVERVMMNPFRDPFVRALAGRPCPMPLGPAYTDAEIRLEEHSRVERGTSCWLAGKCTEPNAYRYDAANAKAAVAALRSEASLATSAIWVTAQRRFIYLEGCVADAAQAARAEAVVKAVPDVDRVIPALSLPGERASYVKAPT